MRNHYISNFSFHRLADLPIYLHFIVVVIIIIIIIIIIFKSNPKSVMKTSVMKLSDSCALHRSTFSELLIVIGCVLFAGVNADCWRLWPFLLES